MFLKQFKGTGPGTIFLIIVTLLTLWASAFIKLQGHFSLYFDLEPMPLYGIMSSLIGTNPMPGIIFTLILVGLMSFLMVNLNTTLFFINERTFIPALIYILFSGFFPQYQLLNPAIFGAIFLMLAIRRIMETYRVPGTAYNFFDAGLLIGIGSLFYANLIWFGLIIFIGLALLRTGEIKEIAISVIGLITPYFLTFGTYYVSGNDLKGLLSTIGDNLFGKPSSYVFTSLTIVAIAFAGLITLGSIIYLLMSMNSKKIKSRKTFYLLLWVFFISISVYFFLPSVSVEIVWITGIPVSYFLTHYFVFAKKKMVPEILFFLLFILIFLIQIWYLK
jgi:hypothetical protein